MIFGSARVRVLFLGVAWMGAAACGSKSAPANDKGLDAASDVISDSQKKEAINVTPARVTVLAGGTQQFNAKVTGSGSASAKVLWTAALGTISRGGLYTAPSETGTDTITATVSGKTLNATAQASVTASPGAGSSGGGSGPSGCLGDGSSLEKACAGANGWGTGLNTSFGRIDGTLIAIAKPTDSQCDQANKTHFVLELSMNGAAYPLVINVEDTANAAGGEDVYFAEADAPLVGVAWQEGWHTDSAEKLDFVKNLSIHSTAFSPLSETDVVNAIVCELSAGDQVSVYALGWGNNGAHDIHRNTGGGGADGAVVLHAAGGNPHYLMFRFVDQSF